jgi:hypothetical protein
MAEITKADYGLSESADLKLADAISNTNFLLLLGAWIALPGYRKYLSGAIEERSRKLFIVPCESLIHALRYKQEYETIQERSSDRGKGTPIVPEGPGGDNRERSHQDPPERL